jgi:hypothetical protein
VDRESSPVERPDLQQPAQEYASVREYPSTPRGRQRFLDDEELFEQSSYTVQSTTESPDRGVFEVRFVPRVGPRLKPPRPKPKATPNVVYRIGYFIPFVLLGAVVVAVLFAIGGLKFPSGGTEGGSQQQTGQVGAWPAGFQDRLCSGALFDLSDAGTHLGALADAARNFDVARATDEAAAVNDRASNAQGQLDALPDWPPAAALVADLRTAATSFRQGANLFQIAVKANDANGFTQAASLIDSGSQALRSATAEIASLRSQYGFSCP